MASDRKRLYMRHHELCVECLMNDVLTGWGEIKLQPFTLFFGAPNRGYFTADVPCLLPSPAYTVVLRRPERLYPRHPLHTPKSVFQIGVVCRQPGPLRRARRGRVLRTKNDAGSKVVGAQIF